MPILTLQQELRTLGALRIGNQVGAKGGKRRPQKLDTFRLTSPTRAYIEAAAVEFGGEVVPWQNRDRDEWEVITRTDTLDIVIPPSGQPVSRWYELWTAAGCERRCDGETMVLTMEPCLCPKDVAQRVALAKDGLACKATTRLSVMLPALPDIGVWLLVSTGYYAAVELAGAAEILQIATAGGHLIRARLRLDQREKRIPGRPTQKYAVPVIEFTDTRLADLPLLAAGGHPERLPLARAAVPALPATTLPERSDFRAPMPVEAPRPDPDASVAETRDGGARPPLGQAEASTCGALSPNGQWACGLAHGHLDAPLAPRVHHALDEDRHSIGTWPAGAAA